MGKTLTTYLSDLRLDLKDSGAVWSDAELTRCVERAVADLSRFIPRELRKDVTVDAEVTAESFTTPAVTSATSIVNAKNISASVSGDTCTLASTVPDVPRPVLVTITDSNSSISKLTLIVKGYDEDSKYVEESFYLGGGLVQTGLVYFSYITEVEIDEIAGNGASDVLSVGVGTHLGVFVSLANKPIKVDTAAITNYTLDTDYIMDYAGGRIAMKSGGTMVASTAYSIAYTKSRLAIDLSALLRDCIRVERVEYPVGSVPQDFSQFEVWDNVLTLTGGVQSQAELSDAEHLIIYYLASHISPSTRAAATYPAVLDCTVELAASAYALFMKALQLEQQALTDQASARTALTSLTDIHSQIVTDRGSVRTILGTPLTDTHALAVAAFAKVITYLEDNTNENAKYWLTKITTDILGLRTAILAAVNAASTAAGKVETVSLDKATTGAEPVLDASATLIDTGDDFINTVNVGANVAENYTAMAQAKATVAQMRIAAASARLNNATAYIQEANSRIELLNSYVNQAIGGWGAVARIFIEQGSAYLLQIEKRLQAAIAYQAAADSGIADLDRYIQTATTYLAAATSCQAAADRLNAEGAERRNEAWAIWGSPHQIAPTYTLGQRSQ